MVLDVDLGGFRITGINAGLEFSMTPAISFMVNFDPATDDDAHGNLAKPFVIPNLMFGGAAQNRAREAREFYTSLFAGSRSGTVAEYPQQTGPAPAGAVMFSDFMLAEQWFAAMDSGVEQCFSFTEGVSLLVECGDQAEIDRLTAALSSVPEAAQCGWCKDRFGVSWQIVPANMGELMTGPDAYQKLLSMTKIEIAGF